MVLSERAGRQRDQLRGAVAGDDSPGRDAEELRQRRPECQRIAIRVALQGNVRQRRVNRGRGTIGIGVSAEVQHLVGIEAEAV